MDKKPFLKMFLKNLIKEYDNMSIYDRLIVNLCFIACYVYSVVTLAMFLLNAANTFLNIMGILLLPISALVFLSIGKKLMENDNESN